MRQQLLHTFKWMINYRQPLGGGVNFECNIQDWLGETFCWQTTTFQSNLVRQINTQSGDHLWIMFNKTVVKNLLGIYVIR